MEAQGGGLPPALTGGDRGVGVKRGAGRGSAPCVACSRGARIRSRPQQSQVLGILERMLLRRRSRAVGKEFSPVNLPGLISTACTFQCWKQMRLGRMFQQRSPRIHSGVTSLIGTWMLGCSWMLSIDPQPSIKVLSL